MNDKIIDLYDVNTIIGIDSVILTDRKIVMTLHKLKNTQKTKCYSLINDVLGGAIFVKFKDSIYDHRGRQTKKCERCFK